MTMTKYKILSGFRAEPCFEQMMDSSPSIIEAGSPAEAFFRYCNRYHEKSIEGYAINLETFELYAVYCVRLDSYDSIQLNYFQSYIKTFQINK